GVVALVGLGDGAGGVEAHAEVPVLRGGEAGRRHQQVAGQADADVAVEGHPRGQAPEGVSAQQPVRRLHVGVGGEVELQPEGAGGGPALVLDVDVDGDRVARGGRGRDDGETRPEEVRQRPVVEIDLGRRPIPYRDLLRRRRLDAGRRRLRDGVGARLEAGDGVVAAGVSHRGRLAGAQEAVAVEVQVDGDAAEALLCLLPYAVAVAVVEHRAVYLPVAGGGAERRGPAQQRDGVDLLPRGGVVVLVNGQADGVGAVAGDREIDVEVERRALRRRVGPL